METISPAVPSATATPREALPYDSLGMDVLSVKEGMLRHLEYTLAELPRHVDSEWEPYVALALAVRDRMVQRWVRTQDTYYDRDVKRVYYLSLEYLMGRTLGNSLINLGLDDEVSQALGELGYRLEDLREAEWDAGLGNGGLGRLAACFLDSLATLGYPSYGYGLRYDYGIFHQRIVDGAQVEVPDGWLRYGNPWEIARLGDRFRVQFHGRVHTYVNDQGRLDQATGWTRGTCWPRRTTRRSPATARKRSTRSGSGARGRCRSSTSRSSTRGLRRRHRGPGALREHLPRALSRTTTSSRARSSAWRRSTSSSRPRSRTSSAATRSATRCSIASRGSGRSTGSPTRWRSSSTTRIPPWPSRS